MKEIIIRSQKEWDALPEKFDEFTVIKIVDSIEIIHIRKNPESSSAELWGSSSAVLWGSSRAELQESSRAVLQESSSAELWGSSSAVLWGSSSAVLWGFSVAFCNSKSCKITKGKYTAIQKPFKAKTLLQWIEIEGVKKSKGKLLLYKRVSKDFKTQEGNPNKTDWIVGKKFKHPNWNPKENECGEGKYHACSFPSACDEFRSIEGDRYICIAVAPKDCYLWPNAYYPHKIAVRAGKVLYECDRFGEKSANGREGYERREL